MASSSSAHQYDVFLSFRGEDTRKQFVSHLYSGFKSQGILTFKDDRELQTGASFSNELPKAIEESKFAVVVISQNYGSSRWCLDELQMIMKRHKKGILNVIPIFYGVDPSDVRKQRGTFAEAFEKHEVTEKPEKVEKWRAALVEVANLTGVDSRTWQDEATMVGNIVRDISNRLLCMTPKDTSDIIGMDTHLEALAPLLSMESGDEVRMIGIWGMGGIGKTTIAKCLYDELKGQFQFHCFIGNIKKTYSEQGRENLQRQFLSKILGAENIKFQGFEIDSNTIKARFRGLKLLAILDDFDDLEQSRALAKDVGWFGPGSRIIITTRDKSLLISHKIELVHEVKCLEDDIALRLFNHFAFGEAFSKDQVPDGFIELSVRASKLVQGLPLALKVLGLFLCGRKIREWEAAISRLRGGPRKTVMECLKVSYDGLDETNKNIFITVACLFTDELVSYISRLVDDEEKEVNRSLEMLAEKSLIDISKDGHVVVHDLIQEMAREIVNQESPNNPGRRRFLWDAKEIYNVLEDGLGTGAIEGISLNMSEIPKCLTRNGTFENMRNLKFLKIHRDCNCKKDLLQIHAVFNHLPRRLRLLDWPGCPLTTLPFGFHAECLVELHLPFSRLERLSEGTLFLGNLRRMDLGWCGNLKEIPSLCTATRLEGLDLSRCDSLVNVPSSFTRLEKLTRLSMRYCSSLTSFPELFESIVELYLDGTRIRKVSESIQNLSALEILVLSECKMLSEISSTIGNLTALKYLDLSDCENLRDLPDTIGCLTALETLTLEGCSMLAEIPSSIDKLTALRDLSLLGCKNLRNLPDTIGCLTALETLTLKDCSMLADIPSTIGNLTALKVLDLLDCKSLGNIPDTIGNLTALESLILSGCRLLLKIPSSICNLTAFKGLDPMSCTMLDLSGCTMLLEIQKSIGNLRFLEILKLQNCQELRNIPDTIGSLTALIALDLSGCMMLLEIPNSIGNLRALKRLHVDNCWKLRSIPETIGSLTTLESLGLSGCKMLSQIPSTIGNLISLEYLSPPEDIICVWKILEAFCYGKHHFSFPNGDPNSVHFSPLQWHLEAYLGRAAGNQALEVLSLNRKNRYWDYKPFRCTSLSLLCHLRELSLRNLNILEIPNDLGCLQALQRLDLSGNDFEIIPASIKQLSLLEQLILSDCEKIRSMPELPSGLKYLYVKGCSSLESTSNVCRHPFQELVLINCFKLGQDPQRLIQQMICSMPLRKEEVKTWACFSVSELPDSFDHQSTEQTLTIKDQSIERRLTFPCPQSVYGLKPMGFVAGIVLAEGSFFHISLLKIHCHWHGEGYQSGDINFDLKNLPPRFTGPGWRIESDLLSVFSCNFGEEKSCDEISFHFNLDVKIKRCGIRLCFTKELQQAQPFLPSKSGICSQDIEESVEEEKFSNLRRVHQPGDIENLNDDEEAQASYSKRPKIFFDFL